jgi:thiol-disulfide isomerase/thioredoxin
MHTHTKRRLESDDDCSRYPVRTLILGMIACIAFGSATWAGDFTAKPTFKIGDPAPAIAPISWIQGTPLTKFEPGRVYVVEFWATWCPPCIKAIPHLSALQKKYPDSLAVVGVNVEGLLGHEPKPDAVPAFMKKWGKAMTYAVAMDDPTKKTISDAWITASGSLGIPTACIVDQHGKLAWVGYPDLVQSYAFDQALDDTLAGKIDLARARALQVSTTRETAEYWAKLNKPTKIPQDLAK